MLRGLAILVLAGCGGVECERGTALDEATGLCISTVDYDLDCYEGVTCYGADDSGADGDARAGTEQQWCTWDCALLDGSDLPEQQWTVYATRELGETCWAVSTERSPLGAVCD